MANLTPERYAVRSSHTLHFEACGRSLTPTFLQMAKRNFGKSASSVMQTSTFDKPQKSPYTNSIVVQTPLFTYWLLSHTGCLHNSHFAFKIQLDPQIYKPDSDLLRPMMVRPYRVLAPGRHSNKALFSRNSQGFAGNKYLGSVLPFDMEAFETRYSVHPFSKHCPSSNLI